MIPGAVLEVIDDCGHMVTMEQPARVADAMLQWLRAPTADRARNADGRAERSRAGGARRSAGRALLRAGGSGWPAAAGVCRGFAHRRARCARSRAPILALRRFGRHRPLPDRRQARARLPRRLAGDARTGARRRSPHDQRAAQQLRAGARREASSADRRRDRDHAAARHGASALLVPTPNSRSCISPGRSRTRLSTSSCRRRNIAVASPSTTPSSPSRCAPICARCCGPAHRTGISICAGRARSWTWSRRPPRPPGPPEAVHLEYFSADSASLAGPKGSFVVKLARHGGEFEIAEGRTIIEVLAEHGVMVDTSCEQGVCGTCLTGVLEGKPDHRDVFLTDAEKVHQRPDDRLRVAGAHAAAGAGPVRSDHVAA